MIEKLNDRIEFVKITSIPNSNGFIEEQETTIYKCWSNKKDVSGKEFFEAYTTNTKISVSFKVRNCKIFQNGTIDSTLKIRYKNKLYNILTILEDNYDSNYLYVKAEIING